MSILIYMAIGAVSLKLFQKYKENKKYNEINEQEHHYHNYYNNDFRKKGIYSKRKERVDMVINHNHYINDYKETNKEKINKILKDNVNEFER